jgi:dCMP deaminase
MKKTTRPSWDAYFMHLAHIVATRSNCIRDTVGAVVVRNKRIITTGYNGAPSGVADCSDGGCQRCLDRDTGKIKPGERKGECICICAEQNAIFQAALYGSSLQDATIYATTAPCLVCARAMINTGIGELVYDAQYSNTLGIDILTKAGVKVRTFNHTE